MSSVFVREGNVMRVIHTLTYFGNPPFDVGEVIKDEVLIDSYDERHIIGKGNVGIATEMQRDAEVGGVFRTTCIVEVSFGVRMNNGVGYPDPTGRQLERAKDLQEMMKDIDLMPKDLKVPTFEKPIVSTVRDGSNVEVKDE